MGGLKLKSPAKLNVYLKVLFKRPDGFHELETLFERICLFDEIELLPRPSGICIEGDVKKIPLGSDNLAYKAAALLKEECAVSNGVLIRIQKNIPVAAGLGGGSSNAATVLLGLNRLWKLKLSRRRLLTLGAKLGSDVPFFLMETPWALGRGRGEILKEISWPKFKLWHCVVKPPFGISTKEAYQHVKPLGLTAPEANAKMPLQSIRKGLLKRNSNLLINSLETALNKRLIEINKIKFSLTGQGALGALMSGSGSSVFGIFSSKAKALKATGFLRKKNPRWKVFTASTY